MPSGCAAELPDTALPGVEAASGSGQAVPLGVGLRWGSSALGLGDEVQLDVLDRNVSLKLEDAVVGWFAEANRARDELLRYLLVVLLLSGCGTTESTTFSTVGSEMSAPANPSPSPTADPAAVEGTRVVVRGGIAAATRQLDEWQGRITLQRDHAITRQYEAALVAIGEEMLEWVEGQRTELADAVSGPCIEESFTAYQSALDELATTTDRLFEAGQTADARVVRALSALEDAADALDSAAAALPESCRG